MAWRRRHVAVWLTVALCLPLALDIPPCLLTKLPLDFHLGTSQSRLILEVSPVAILALGLALARAEISATPENPPPPKIASLTASARRKDEMTPEKM